jgi:hypothetical protein
MVAESWEYLRRSRVATRQLELQIEEIREKCERARAAMQSFHRRRSSGSGGMDASCKPRVNWARAEVPIVEVLRNCKFPHVAAPAAEIAL